MRTLESAIRAAVAAFLFACSGAVGAYWIGFAPTPVTVGINTPFSIDIVVTGLATEGELVSAYDFTIGYDLTLLQFLGAQPSGALGAGTVFVATPGSGSVNLFAFSLLPDAALEPLQGDSITLATLSFTGIGIGTSSLVFSDFFAFGGRQVGQPGQTVTADLLALPHTVGQASIETTANAIPEPATLALALLALLALAARPQFRRR